MDEDALREEVLARLIRFIAGVVLHNSEVSRRVGLGPSDSQFLGLLTTEGPLTPGQLATMTGLTTGTVTACSTASNAAASCAASGMRPTGERCSSCRCPRDKPV